MRCHDILISSSGYDMNPTLVKNQAQVNRIGLN